MTITFERLYSLEETAKRLGISVKTLREHVRCGRIRCVLVGNGTKRKRRKFTAKNINSFIEGQKVREVPQCPSTKKAKAPTIAMTSGSTVIAFTAIQKQKANAKPKHASAT
jgi:hypothetical protein